MAGEVERYTENAVEGFVELSVLPKARVTVKRAWGTRVTELVEETADKAGVSVDDIDDRAISNEAFSDLVMEAADRATRVADREYRSMLARLLAGAMDDARIDESAHILQTLIQLEPVHLRVLLLAWDRHLKGPEAPAEPRPLGRTGPQTLRGDVFDFEIVEKLRVDRGLAEALARSLVNASLVEDEGFVMAGAEIEKRLSNPVPGAFIDGRCWRLTEYGLRAIRVLYGSKIDGEQSD